MYGLLSENVRSTAITDAVRHSVIYYETLLRLYYMRHSFRGADMLLTHFFAIFALSTLEKHTGSKAILAGQSMPNDIQSGETDGTDDETDAARSSIVLVELALCHQGTNYYLPQTLFHVILNRLRARDANLVRRYADVAIEGDEARQLRAAHMRSHYPVSVTNITNPKTMNKLDSMMSEYADLSLETASESEPPGSSPRSPGKEVN
jgi:hypothetical protein